MSISGISSSNTWSLIQKMQQKMAESLFAQLDTSGQGYIDKATLQAALDKTSSSSGSTTSTSSVDALFSRLDTNGDGKITKQEFTDTLQQLESQLQANANLQSGSMPPPPPPDDAGFTKAELTSQLSEIGSSDSKRSALISDIVNNFDAADTNGDGKVSMQEAMAYEQSKSSSSTATSSASSSSTSSTAATDDTSAKILQQIMQLLKAYNTDNSSVSSGTLSLLA